MLSGPDILLHTSSIIIGALILDAICSISHIYASPFEDVTVAVLAFESDAPIDADIALCSLSTSIRFDNIFPSAIYLEKYSGISVDGVIGNEGNTSTPICLNAFAAALFPTKLCLHL
jgi:hypothetical protein